MAENLSGFLAWKSVIRAMTPKPVTKETDMRKLGQFLIWLLIAPGDLIADRLRVTTDNNRDLVRMLINSLFWIMVAVVGLAIWTSTLPQYQ